MKSLRLSRVFFLILVLYAQPRWLTAAKVGTVPPPMNENQ
jgi:hypothetical protein